MITETTLVELSGQVYWLDSKSIDYDIHLKKNGVKKYGGVNYQILKTEDNTTNGMQAMAVAPMKQNEVDTSDIIIAYAGTSPKDINDIKTDIQTVVLGDKDYLMKRERIGFTTTSIPILVESQITSAGNFANDVKSEYPNANVTTTGHSLGEYLALYVAAENQWKNVGFNGPDPYRILSSDAKKWVKDNPGMLFNYRNAKDKIGNYDGNGTGAEIMIDMHMGSKMKDTLAFHNLSTWEFDEDGQIKIKNTAANQEARQVLAEKLMYNRMSELELLANNLYSNGVLSSNERIYLNDMEALIIVESASQAMSTALESVIQLYKVGIKNAEETWREGIRIAQSIGTELTYSEILATLSASGITEYSIVHGPTAYYRKKISLARQIEFNFEQLVSAIKESIKKLVQTDKSLAVMIEEGV